MTQPHETPRRADASTLASDTWIPQGNAAAYLLIAGLGLTVFLLADVGRGGLFTIFMALVGVLALRTRWGPLLVLFIYACSLWSTRLPWRQRGGGQVTLDPSLPLEQVLVCIGLLAYSVGHYRLQAIWHSILPIDPRQRSGPARFSFWHLRRVTPLLPQRRPAAHVTPVEIAWAVLVLPLAPVVALMYWSLLSRPWGLFDYLEDPWPQVLWLLWTLGIGIFLTATFLGIWRQRQQSPEEARLFLQDCLWRETRGEQRRLARWLAWQRLRARATSSPPLTKGGQGG